MGIAGLLIMSDTIDRLDDSSMRFARSAVRHRNSKDRIRHVIASYLHAMALRDKYRKRYEDQK